MHHSKKSVANRLIFTYGIIGYRRFSMEKLANVDDVPEGKGIMVRAKDGSEIALFCHDGKIYALDNVCPHMGGPLGEGELEGCIVTCPWHGWQFDVTNGECVNMPGDDAKTFKITIQNHEIFLT